MKATLEFDLPEEDWALRAAEQGQDCQSVIRDLLNWLKWQLDADTTSERFSALNEVRAKVYEELSDFGIDVDAD